MPRCGRLAKRAVSRPVCPHEKNQALSVDRKLLGTSKRASHPARPVPAVAPHGPRCSAVACRSAIGRPILTIRCLCRCTGSLACFRLPRSTQASTAGWRRNSRPLPASRGLPSPRLNQGRAAVTVTAMPSKFQKSRRVAATTFRWMLPTRPPVATDGKVGPPGRSPKGLFRLVHNCE